MFKRLFLFAVVTGLLAPSAIAQQDQLQLDDLLGAGGGFGVGGTVEVTARLVAPKVEPGAPALLQVQVQLPFEHYIYSLNPAFSGGTKIKLTPAGALTPVGSFRADREPEKVDEKYLGPVEKFHDQVTWSHVFRLGENPQGATISGELSGQYCSSGKGGACTPIRPPAKFTATLTEDADLTIDPALLSEPEPELPEQAAGPSTDYKLTPRRGRRQTPDPLEMRFRLVPDPATPEIVSLVIRMDMEGNWHTFSQNQNPENYAEPTQFTIDEIAGLDPIDEAFMPDRAASVETPLNDGTEQLVFHEHAMWSRKYRLQAGGSLETAGVRGTITYQVCDTSCLPANTVEFSLGALATARLAGTAASTPDQPVAQSGTDGAANTDAADAAPAPAEFAVEPDDPRKKGLLMFILSAVGAGLLALLTPCVFPMVPITVSFFLKQSESGKKPLPLATIYCLGIIGTFSVIGLVTSIFFRATALTALANDPWLNIFIAGVLVFFGFNLLGMFEIRVPTWLLKWTSSKEGGGGVVGTLFMATTFTLVSFTCTFAFVGALLVWASQGDYYWATIGMLAFSTAFATPFFFLALFPAYLKKLPKSGGWMNTVKVTMGIIEVGAALKFLSVADLAWNPTPAVFDYAFCMTTWSVLAGCAGLYLLGLFRLPHDMPVETISVPRFAFAVMFLGGATYLGVGLFGRQEPTGVLWGQIAAFAPPVFETEGAAGLGALGPGDRDSYLAMEEVGPIIMHDGLAFSLDFDKARTFARLQNTPLFLDFTGVNCINCRKMENEVMPLPPNHTLLKEFVRVQLYTDKVPVVRDQALMEKLLERNRELQETWFQDVTLPAYAVTTPDGTRILSQFKGLDTSAGGTVFQAFLEKGLSEWETIRSGETESTAGEALTRR